MTCQAGSQRKTESIALKLVVFKTLEDTLMISEISAKAGQGVDSITTVFDCSVSSSFEGHDFPFLINEELTGKRCTISFSSRFFRE